MKIDKPVDFRGKFAYNISLKFLGRNISFFYALMDGKRSVKLQIDAHPKSRKMRRNSVSNFQISIRVPRIMKDFAAICTQPGERKGRRTSRLISTLGESNTDNPTCWWFNK